MADNSLGEFYFGDVDSDLPDGDDELIVAPGVPFAPQTDLPASGLSAPAVAAVPAQAPAPAPMVPQPVASSPAVPAPAVAPFAPTQPPVQAPPQPTMTREELLAAALDRLMDDNQEIQAAALVSLDGFTMASALPEGMHEDRVGAMSAAILGLGERAAAELGKGRLSQVFIEGADGYVVLIAAGSRAVLTCLAGMDAKLGLVLYDMRAAADAIGPILG
jgi:uncharacterized protein